MGKKAGEPILNYGGKKSITSEVDQNIEVIAYHQNYGARYKENS